MPYSVHDNLVSQLHSVLVASVSVLGEIHIVRQLLPLLIELLEKLISGQLDVVIYFPREN